MLKRLFLFMFVLLLTSVSAMAEDWPFKIMGIQVTDENAGSICEISGETAFWAEKKEDSSYWIYIHQPESAAQILYVGSDDENDYLITFNGDVDNVYICVENDVVIRNNKGQCIGVDQSILPERVVSNLHFTSLSGFNSLSCWGSSLTPINLYNIYEVYVSNVQLVTNHLKGHGALYVKDFGFISAKRIYSFEDITVQDDAQTNAASFKKISDGNRAAARDKDDEVIVDGVTVGIVGAVLSILTQVVISSEIFPATSITLNLKLAFLAAV